MFEPAEEEQKEGVEINLTFKPFEMHESREEAKDNILAKDSRFAEFEFDINHEIKELIKRYTGNINMEYGTSGMDDLNVR